MDFKDLDNKISEQMIIIVINLHKEGGIQKIQ